jgi:hypothetical protein
MTTYPLTGYAGASYSQADIIDSRINAKMFADYGTVTAVNGDKVDVTHATVQYLLSGQRCEPCQTKSIEVLYPATAAFSIKYPVAVGDRVLLIGLHSYVEAVADVTDEGSEPLGFLHYHQATMKAIPLGSIDASDVRIEIDEDGNCSATLAKKLDVSVDDDVTITLAKKLEADVGDDLTVTAAGKVSTTVNSLTDGFAVEITGVGKIGLKNAANSLGGVLTSTVTDLNSLVTALTTFAEATKLSQTDPVLVAAAIALSSSLSSVASNIATDLTKIALLLEA